MKQSIRVNGKTHFGGRLHDYVVRGVLKDFGYGELEDYDINIVLNINATPKIQFKPGDVVIFAYYKDGPEYTIVRKTDGWTAQVTDSQVVEAIKAGHAWRAKVVRA